MSKITHHNIEEWLFNYSEGNLKSSEVKELKSFLQVHPEYTEELKFWQNAKIEESVPEFNNDSLHEIANKNLKGIKRTTALLSLFFLASVSCIWYFVTLFNNDSNTTQNNPSNTFNLSSNQLIENNSTTNHHRNSIYSSDLKNTEINDESLTDSENKKNTHKNNHRPFAQNSNSKSHNKSSFNSNKNINTMGNNNVYENTLPLLNEDESIMFENNQNNNINLSESYLTTEKPQKITHRNNLYEGFRKDYLKADVNHIAYKKETAKIELSEQRKSNNKKFLDYELGFHNSRNIYLLHTENNILNEYAAAAGTNGTENLHLNYLNRFTGSVQNAHTYIAGIDFYNKKLKSGFALLTRYNDIGKGKINNLNINLLYSYKIKIDRNNSLETGLGIGYNQITSNGNEINPIVEITPSNQYILFGNNNTLFRKWSLSASSIYHSKYFYAMAGSDFIIPKNIFRVNDDYAYLGYLPPKFKVVVGSDFKRYHDSPWSISPQMSYIHRGKQKEFWMGGMYRYRAMGAGISLASNKQIMSSLNLTYDRFMIGYNLNYGKSYYNNQYYFSHEANMRMAFNALQKKKVAILDSEK